MKSSVSTLRKNCRVLSEYATGTPQTMLSKVSCDRYKSLLCIKRFNFSRKILGNLLNYFLFVLNGSLCYVNHYRKILRVHLLLLNLTAIPVIIVETSLVKRSGSRKA